MWAFERVFYQFYPLGVCGAPYENDGKLEHRFLRILDFLPHLKKMHVGAIYFSPLFESDTHGYNTVDYRTIDKRLGTNDDFKRICEAFHKEDIKIILDGVFNHVGRGFLPFQDVLRNRENSIYKDWFYIHFDGNNHYNDGLWYEGWEGHFDLVKLNLKNPEVIQYLIESVKFWIQEFEIDGLRLDVAYMVDREFLKTLRRETSARKPDFFLVGEMIHGDYNQLVNDEICHSATNYECYKGLYSSFNSLNLFEIMHSLQRQFGEENWTLYRGKHLLSFVDNHDVSRIASILQKKEHLKPIYTLMMTMPGIPMIYYGSEWGILGDKKEGDSALRPEWKEPIFNSLSIHISKLAKIFSGHKALQYGNFKSLQIKNKICAYAREWEGERILIVVNADEKTEELYLPFAYDGVAMELLSEEKRKISERIEVPAYGSLVLKL